MDTLSRDTLSPGYPTPGCPIPRYPIFVGHGWRDPCTVMFHVQWEGPVLGPEVSLHGEVQYIIGNGPPPPPWTE